MKSSMCNDWRSKPKFSLLAAGDTCSHSFCRRFFPAVCLLLVVGGCASAPAPVPPSPLPPPTGAVPTVVAIAPPATQPLTLPQFLGLDVVARAGLAGVRHTRMKLAARWPVLQPAVRNSPAPIGAPENLQSPSPAVASAAAIQQANADAPAKAQALGFLATVDCGQHPQAEVAFLAGLDDINQEVRAAAVQAIIDSQRHCGKCQCSCAGCCTIAIRAKLTCLAYDKEGPGCYCEPSPRVRRLARIALGACGGPALETIVELPEELPPPAILELLQVVPPPQ